MFYCHPFLRYREFNSNRISANILLYISLGEYFSNLTQNHNTFSTHFVLKLCMHGRLCSEKVDRSFFMTRLINRQGTYVCIKGSVT